MSSVYVYYRVSDAARLRPIAERLLEDVAAKSGIHGRLLRRADDAATWMEVYDGVEAVPAFLASLQRLAAEAGFDGCGHEKRHEETFVPL